MIDVLEPTHRIDRPPGRVVPSALSASDLLDEVLSQFGPGLVRSKAGRLRILNERFQPNAQRGVCSVLVVDEAQAIERLKAFEELRLLTNFPLNDRFLDPGANRPAGIWSSCYGNSPVKPADCRGSHLGPFTPEETMSYITAPMGAATDRTGIFTEEP